MSVVNPLSLSIPGYYLLGLLFLGLLGLAGSLYLTRNLVSIKRRRKEWQVVDAFIMAGGATGLNLLDLYMECDNHEEALENLQRVANNVIPEDASPLEWAGYFDEKLRAGESSRQGLVSLWKGSLAEDEAVDYLNNQDLLNEYGIVAERYPNPNHQGTDIRFVKDGQVLGEEELEEYGLNEVQVKSYDPQSLDDFIKEVFENPEPHYVVNHELYEKLEETGWLEKLPTTIRDGRWSDVALEDQCHIIIGDFEDGVDLADDIPVIACCMLGYKTFKNVIRFCTNQMSPREAAVEFALDGTRYSLRGTGALAGVKGGALIGGLVMPGVGTLAGSFFGAIAGACATSALWKSLKEKFKYGTIMQSCEHIGDKYYNALVRRDSGEMASIKNSLPESSKLNAIKNEQLSLANVHEVPLEVTAAESPTLVKALLARSVQRAEHMVATAKEATNIIAKKLTTFVDKITYSESGSSKRAHGTLGFLVATQSGFLVEGCEGYRSDIETVLSEIKKYPNHPYLLRDEKGKRIDESTFLKTLMVESLEEASRIVSGGKLPWVKPLKKLWLLLALCVGLFIVSIAGVSFLAKGANPVEFFHGASAGRSQQTKMVQASKDKSTEKKIRTGKVVANALNVRSKPSSSATIVHYLKKGDEVLVLETRHPWIRIKAENEKVGWVYYKYLEIINNNSASLSPEVSGYKQGEIENFNNYFVNWTKGKVIVKGEGAPILTPKTVEEARLTALIAAFVCTLRKYFEITYGVTFDHIDRDTVVISSQGKIKDLEVHSKTTLEHQKTTKDVIHLLYQKQQIVIEDFVLKSPKIERISLPSFDKLPIEMSGIKIIDANYGSDGSVEVTLEGPIRGSIVIAKGTGTTRENALDDAYRNAVDQSVGFFLSTETVTKNYQLISDRIRPISRGYIDSYRLLSAGEKGERYWVKIGAHVRYLPENMPILKYSYPEIDGEKVYAKLKTAARALKDRVKIFEEAIGNTSYPQSYIDVRFHHKTEPDSSAGGAILILKNVQYTPKKLDFIENWVVEAYETRNKDLWRKLHRKGFPVIQKDNSDYETSYTRDYSSINWYLHIQLKDAKDRIIHTLTREDRIESHQRFDNSDDVKFGMMTHEETKSRQTSRPWPIEYEEDFVRKYRVPMSTLRKTKKIEAVVVNPKAGNYLPQQ